MVINTELDIIQYVKCVDDIAEKFFNEGLDYDPAVGVLHAMCVFYNLCVEDSKFKDSLGDMVHDVLDIREVAKDPEFVKEFNKAIRKQDDFCLNFGNAYKQAMDIVETKKNPVNNVIELIRELGLGALNSMGELFKNGGIAIPDTMEFQSNSEDGTATEE